MNSSLTKKIIIRIILIVLISMILFTVLGNRIISNRFEEFSFTLGKRYAQQIATQLSIEYADYQNWNEALEILDALNPSSSENGNPNGEGLGPINSGQGQGLGQGLGQGNNPQNQPPAQNIPPTTPFTQQPTATPNLIRSILGLLTHDESEFEENSQDIHKPQRGNIQNVNRETIIVFDQDKKMIFAVDSNQLLNDINPYDFEDQWISIQVGKQTVGYVMVGSTVGILPIAQKVLLNQITFLIILMGLFIGFFIILITYLQMKHIIHPLKELSQSSAAIAHGNLEQHIDINSNDEIGDLAHSFNQMAVELKEQQTLRKRTTADIAHELRTPLTVMQIDLESIEDGILKPDQDVIQRLQYQVSHLGNMVNDLRILSLSDAGELILEKEILDMVPFLDGFVERMRSLGTEKQIQFKKNFKTNHALATFDAKRITQVLTNLLHNALRHSPSNSQITFSLEQYQNKILISISDQGEGIPADKVEVIFNRFYRLEEARSRDTGGSGLGLAICKNLVEEHAGKIWAESEVGHGTTFFIELPAHS